MFNVATTTGLCRVLDGKRMLLITGAYLYISQKESFPAALLLMLFSDRSRAAFDCHACATQFWLDVKLFCSCNKAKCDVYRIGATSSPTPPVPMPCRRRRAACHRRQSPWRHRRMVACTREGLTMAGPLHTTVHHSVTHYNGSSTTTGRRVQYFFCALLLSPAELDLNNVARHCWDRTFGLGLPNDIDQHASFDVLLEVSRAGQTYGVNRVRESVKRVLK